MLQQRVKIIEERLERAKSQTHSIYSLADQYIADIEFLLEALKKAIKERDLLQDHLDSVMT